MIMRILWLCNTVPNDFADEFQIKKRPMEGWIESMLHLLKADDKLTIGCCVPIRDEDKMKNGVCSGQPYYAYHASMDKRSYESAMADEFKVILRDFQPDVIHAWGTEQNHSLAMAEACRDLNLDGRLMIRTQGIMSVYALHYTLGIPEKYWEMAEEGSVSLAEEMRSFFNRRQNDESIWKITHWICDRGDWGEFCVKAVNPRINYECVDNVLRQGFYEHQGEWQKKNCQSHRIFVAQGHYPVKGIHFLLRAMGILKAKYPGMELFVAGENILSEDNPKSRSGYARYLMDLLRVYGLEEKVHYLGYLTEDEMIAQYLKANVTVSPSTIENRANAICEGMMLGVPVVASYVGGNLGAITHEKDGYFYPVDEYYMLAGYLDRIFSDDVLAGKLSLQAVLTAKQRHGKEIIRDKMIRLYEKIAQTAKRS